MKAVTLQQPWAGLLALGIKQIETRSWNTKFRGRIAVHASAKISKEGLQLLDILHEKYPLRGFNKGYVHEVLTTTGCILGEVEIVETHRSDDAKEVFYFGDWNEEQLEKMLGDWTPGRWLWECAHPILYTHPIPVKGALSIWNWEKPESAPTLQTLTTSNLCQ